MRLRIGRVGSAILSVACLGLFVVFGALFHLQYSRWRGCFNEQGRCFDAEAGVVYQAQSGIVWGALAVVALGVSGMFLWGLVRAGR
ncbi:hypothetical protein [Roseovarius sp.]|uniref:hypothetical protein n=1 Tax=Roseovarius sp. TaxID=1486281 RepID=UPI0026019F23|nr:hypothetical protein [Roseovarius sp.]MDM8168508.1 hypothetical protein [Roseovarius sp.]